MCPFNVDLGDKLKITIPKLGDKRKILDLSFRNAKYYRLDKLKQIKITDPDRAHKPNNGTNENRFAFVPKNLGISNVLITLTFKVPILWQPALSLKMANPVKKIIGILT